MLRRLVELVASGECVVVEGMGEANGSAWCFRRG
jgi:hypothetical protein